MKYPILIAILLAAFSDCEPKPKPISSMNPVNWKKRSIDLSPADSSLYHGSSYLSVYSEVYERTEKLTYGLTVTVSMRNISSTDSVFLFHAHYYNTDGELIRSYFEHPIFIRPMETVEIVIDEIDKGGGTGGNFLFDWSTRSSSVEPFFEAVMISTTGQQGISFTTQGVRR